MSSKSVTKSVGVDSNGDSGNESEVSQMRRRLEEHESRHLKIKSEFDELKTLNEDIIARHDKQLKEMKLDLRIAKKDAEKWKDSNKYLRDDKKELREQLVTTQTTADELKLELRAKDEAIEQLKDQIKTLQMEFEASQRGHQKMKSSHEERVNALTNEAKALREELNKGLNWKIRFDESNRRAEQTSSETEVIKNQMKTIELELNLKNNDIQTKDKELKKLKNTIKVLREQCSQMDSQAEQFKSKYVGLGQQTEQILAVKDSTESEVQKLNREMEAIRHQLNASVKQKEDISRRLESEQQEFQNKVSTEREKLMALDQQFQDVCQKNREYEERLRGQEYNLYSSDEAIVTLESKVRQLDDQLIAIKEEAAKHITTIANMNDVNRDLKIAFEESMEKLEDLQERIDSLHHHMDLKEEELNRERITSQDTIGQHLKLIDYLKERIESLEKQKKPLFSITPTKKFVNNSPLTVCPIELKDLDRALAEEKTKNRRLTEELNKLKALKQTKVLKNSINADLKPDLQIDQTFRKPLFSSNKNKSNKKRAENQLQTQASGGSQRMHHNIPHRFTEQINKIPNNKCVSCAESIHFGRKVMKCSECNATTHTKCADTLSNNCGLPVQLMQQLFHSSNDVNEVYAIDDYYHTRPVDDIIEVHPLEPSAPEETFTKYDDNSDSSATTDNNESDSGAVLSKAMNEVCDSFVREIEEICANKENDGFSFTDSMIEQLESHKN